MKNLNPSTDAIATSDVPQIEERWIVPRKFSIPDTSGLTVEVTDGGKNNFTIELKD
ncbi:MAG: hypothetical protein K8U57_21255 [Planctomycetes bacterium]|nr:hypothetical protein [Planctomycetota bacterium]